MIELLNPCFQLNLDVAGQPCLVIGGGDEATDKVDRLVEAGARVVVVSPEVTERLRQQGQLGHISHEQRAFEPRDLDGVLLVINTVRDSPSLTRQVYDLGCERGLLINSYDQPAFSNFGMVALVRPGHLRIGISTSNASPSLAGRLRRDMESLFDAEFVEFLDTLAAVRQHLRQSEKPPAERMRLLRSLVDGFKLDGRLTYPKDWRQHMSSILED